jgi:hypothetical protein
MPSHIGGLRNRDHRFLVEGKLGKLDVLVRQWLLTPGQFINRVFPYPHFCACLSDCLGVTEYSPRCSTPTEDAHLMNMSTFQTDEHLQALTSVLLYSLREADRSAVGYSPESIMIKTPNP